MSELETIFSEGKTVKIGKKDILVKNIALGDMPVLIAIFSKVADLLPKKKGQELNQTAIGLAIAQNFDDFLKLFEVTTDLKAEEIKKLNIAASVQIFAKVLGENMDFLELHVKPVVKDLIAKMESVSKSKS